MKTKVIELGGVRTEFVRIDIQLSILEEIIQDYEDRADDMMREGRLLTSYDLKEIADILKDSLRLRIDL